MLGPPWERKYTGVRPDIVVLFKPSTGTLPRESGEGIELLFLPRSSVELLDFDRKNGIAVAMSSPISRIVNREMVACMGDFSGKVGSYRSEKSYIFIPCSSTLIPVWFLSCSATGIEFYGRRLASAVEPPPLVLT
jgi:hypothetical protein